MRRKRGHGPWPPPSGGAFRSAYADAERVPFWLDSPDRPAAATAARWVRRGRPGDRRRRAQRPVGGGAREGARPGARRDPPRRERGSPTRPAGATAASARRFSPTGSRNGMARFPEEMRALERLGLANFDAIAADDRALLRSTARSRPAAISTSPSRRTRSSGSPRRPRRCEELGHDVELLDRDAIGEQLRSPLPRAAMWRKSGAALVDPARLCWGLARVAVELGVRIHEHTHRRGG